MLSTHRRAITFAVAFVAALASMLTLIGGIPGPDAAAQPAGLASRAPAGFSVGGVLHGYNPTWKTGGYAELAATEFNAITTTAYLPWGPTPTQVAPGTPADEIPIDTGPFESVVEWATERNMLVHGHTLLYPAANATSDWYLDASLDGQRTSLNRRFIQAVAGADPGSVHVWDVVNEVMADPPRHETGYGIDEWGLRTDFVEYTEIGPDYVDRAFRWADDVVDEDVALIINDYGAETLNPKSDALLAYVIELRRRGVPIDGVGFQMHLDSLAIPDYASIEANLRRFADAGFDLYITELDVRSTTLPDPDARPTATELARQAEVYRTITELALRVPRLNTLLMWDFADGRSWLNPTNRPLGDLPIGSYTHPSIWAGGRNGEPFAPKPAYEAVSEALDAPRSPAVRISNGWDRGSGYLTRLGLADASGPFLPTDRLHLHRLDGVSAGWSSMFWAFEPTGDGYYRIRGRWETDSGYLGRSGDWDGQAWWPTDAVHLGPFDPTGWHQQWRISGNGDGTIAIVNRWEPVTGVLTRDGNLDPDGRYSPGDTVSLHPPQLWSSQHWHIE